MSRITKRKVVAGVVGAGILGVAIATPTVAIAADGDEPSRAKTSATAVQGDERQRTVPKADTLALRFDDSTGEATISLGETRGEDRTPTEQRACASAEAQATPADSFAASSAEKPIAVESLQPMHAQRLTRAVEEGTITQEQADAITEAMSAGVLSGQNGHDVPRD